jgi:hypothetical protein
MRRRGRTHRRTNGVDGGIDDFRHSGDDSDRATAASNSGGRDGEAKRHRLGQRRYRERWPVGTGEAGRRVPAAAWDGAVGTAFKPPDLFGHRRPQQPIGARRGATPPLTVAADRWDPLVSVFRIKNHPRTKIAQNK